MPPDVEALLLGYLRGRPELAGVTVGTRRPADLPARLPFVLLTRTGGAGRLPTWRPGPLLDRAGLAVQAWASPDLAAARTVVHAVLGVLYAARGVPLPGGAVLVRAVPVSGPTAVPDPAAPDHIHRVVASVLVTVHNGP